MFQRLGLVAATVIGLLVLAGAARAESALTLAGELPLAGTRGRIDHMTVDLARERLVVAEYGNDTLDVIGLATGRRFRRIAGLAKPQGVGYSPRADVVVVSNGGDGTVRLYRGGDLAPIGSVALGRDADDLRVDPRSGDFLVAHGDGGIAIIDPARGRKIGDIKVPSHPESFQLDTRTGRIFVNLPHLPSADRIAVVDLAGRRQIARWFVLGLRDNFSMALDKSGRLLVVVFWHPPRLVLLGTATGAVHAKIDACGDADDAYFDAKRRRIYVSCGQGEVDVFEKTGTGYRRVARIRTARGARTSLFVPQLDRLYVAAPAVAGSTAKILVFRPLP